MYSNNESSKIKIIENNEIEEEKNIIKIQSYIRGHCIRRKNNPLKYIKYYYDKYLKKNGVKIIHKNTGFYYVLEYLYLNIKKQCNIEDIKEYVLHKGITLKGGDSLQVRHIGMQKGYNLLKGGDTFGDNKIKKSNFLLLNLNKCFNGFTSEKCNKNITDDLWNKIILEYDNKCVNCGSENNKPLRWNKNKLTTLQQGHMNPLKPLTVDNIIPQCAICNQQYKNKAIFNKRGFVIDYKKEGFTFQSV
jgi:hypothetical protein